MKNMLNALTIDWEYWWNNKFLGTIKNKEKKSIQRYSIDLLNLLDEYGIKATFFILGSAAEEQPEIVKEIFKRGHEIALHGYSHKEISRLSKKEFEKEISKSLNIINQITRGKTKINGFRAPYFSFSNSNKWMLDSLKKYAIGGGFYFRLLPIWALRSSIKQINKSRPAILYLHVWEIVNNTPNLNILSYPSRVSVYIGRHSVQNKLKSLLTEFKFGTIEQVLKNTTIYH